MSRQKYQLLRIGDYPETDLPLFGVFPADDPQSHYIGEVWSVGVKGVTAKWIPTGVRYQLNGDYTESPLFGVGCHAEAARAMIAKYEGNQQ